MSTISINRSELKSMVKEAVKKKLASLKEQTQVAPDPTPAPSTPAPVMESANPAAIRELALYMEAKGMKTNGSITKLVNEAAVKYIAEYGKKTDKVDSVFSPTDRKILAKALTAKNTKKS